MNPHTSHLNPSNLPSELFSLFLTRSSILWLISQHLLFPYPSGTSLSLIVCHSYGYWPIDYIFLFLCFLSHSPGKIPTESVQPPPAPKSTHRLLRNSVNQCKVVSHCWVPNPTAFLSFPFSCSPQQLFQTSAPASGPGLYSSFFISNKWSY